MDIITYKLAARQEFSAGDIIKIHYAHSRANSSKVLFTTTRAPRVKYHDVLKKLILTTGDGSIAIIGDIVDLGRYGIREPHEDYSTPSIFNNEQEIKEAKAWFCLENVERIIINEGDYISINGVDLLQAIKFNAYMVYVEENK